MTLLGLSNKAPSRKLDDEVIREVRKFIRLLGSGDREEQDVAIDRLGKLLTLCGLDFKSLAHAAGQGLKWASRRMGHTADPMADSDGEPKLLLAMAEHLDRHKRRFNETERSFIVSAGVALQHRRMSPKQESWLRELHERLGRMLREEDDAD